MPKWRNSIVYPQFYAQMTEFDPATKICLKTHKATILHSKFQIPILQDWLYIPDIFCRPELKTFTKNVHQNLYWMSAANNQQSTEFKMVDVKPVINKRR